MRLVNLNISGKLILGFATVCVVLAAAVGYTIFMIGGVSHTVERMVQLRVPVSMESSQLVGKMYATLASLCGYLLTGDAQTKADRAAVWKELGQAQAGVDRMAGQFTNPENKRKWGEVKTLLGQFRSAQDKAESIAFTPDALPATEAFINEAMPRADIMFGEITRMIDEEQNLEASAERKQLLKAMADTRGHFSASIGALRLFLLSGETSAKDRFGRDWQLSERGLAAVTARAALLNAAQRTSFAAFNKAHGEFGPLADKVFALRESPAWNAPVHIFVTEAAPLAAKVLDLLEGEKGADGTRSGGIKTNQQLMLAQESQEVSGGIFRLTTVEWILLGVGLLAAATIGFFTARSIIKPPGGMVAAMHRLAQGDFDVALPDLGRKDEIGAMAGAVERFKVIAVEKAQREAEEKEAEARAAAAVEEQGAATQEIARNVQQAAQGTSQVATNIVEVSRGANETGSASNQVLSSAQSLSNESNHLKLEVDKFLVTVRAA